MSKELHIEAWRESQDNQQDILEALYKLIGGEDFAIRTLIWAYGEACKDEAIALIKGGFANNDEAMAAWMQTEGKCMLARAGRRSENA